MSPYLRKVKTASGATAVQIAEKVGGKQRILGHVGSAHSEVELAILMAEGNRRLRPGQLELDLDPPGHAATTAKARGLSSQILWGVLEDAYSFLGFDVVGDEAFKQLVLARLIEPTSKLDTIRVLDEIGVAAPHISTIKRCLKRVQERDYRAVVSQACFEHVHTRGGGDVSLILYDVTTLYFEAEDEDNFKKQGYSKERRIDPQIVVGLLVDRTGFPLEIQCFEGDKGETLTLIPVIKAFKKKHGIEDMVVVADAGMLSNENLKQLEAQQLRFIVGSRMTKAPHDLAKHFHWNGTLFTDGQIIDTVTAKWGHGDKDRIATRAEPVWDREEHPAHWRAVWHYSASRARRDERNLNKQEARAREIATGQRAAKKARFLASQGGRYVVNETTLQRARDLAGLKGYVTNIPARVMPAHEVISAYHDLWHVEQSFRMSKSDLAARPIFHHTREAIEAHLTIVFAALAVARDVQNRSGISLKKLLTTLRPLRHVTIAIGATEATIPPEIPAETQAILKALKVH